MSQSSITHRYRVWPAQVFLVYINDLLSTGYIADLFTAEDKEAFSNAVRNEVKASGGCARTVMLAAWHGLLWSCKLSGCSCTELSYACLGCHVPWPASPLQPPCPPTPPPS